MQCEHARVCNFHQLAARAQACVGNLPTTPPCTHAVPARVRRAHPHAKRSCSQRITTCVHLSCSCAWALRSPARGQLAAVFWTGLAYDGIAGLSGVVMRGRTDGAGKVHVVGYVPAMRRIDRHTPRLTLGVQHTCIRVATSSTHRLSPSQYAGPRVPCAPFRPKGVVGQLHSLRHFMRWKLPELLVSEVTGWQRSNVYEDGAPACHPTSQSNLSASAPLRLSASLSRHCCARLCLFCRCAP